VRPEHIRVLRQQETGLGRSDDARLIQQSGGGVAEAVEPSLGDRNRRASLLAAPDLTAQPGRVIHDAYANAAFGGSASSGNSCRPRPDDDDVERKKAIIHRK